MFFNCNYYFFFLVDDCSFVHLPKIHSHKEISCNITGFTHKHAVDSQHEMINVHIFKHCRKCVALKMRLGPLKHIFPIVVNASLSPSLLPVFLLSKALRVPHSLANHVLPWVQHHCSVENTIRRCSLAQRGHSETIDLGDLRGRPHHSHCVDASCRLTSP